MQDHVKNSVFKQRIKFNPDSHANITVINIPSDVWFIVLQVHTFQYNITIGYDKTTLDKVSNRSLFGSNIGLYFETHNVTTPIQAFLKNDNVRSVDMLVAIVTYGQKCEYKLYQLIIYIPSPPPLSLSFSAAFSCLSGV